MTKSIEETIRQTVGDHADPETGRPIQTMGQLRSVAVENQIAKIDVGLSSHSMPIQDDFRDAIESKVVAAAPGITPEITISEHDRPPVRLGQIALRAKSVIAVGSGKGVAFLDSLLVGETNWKFRWGSIRSETCASGLTSSLSISQSLRSSLQKLV